MKTTEVQFSQLEKMKIGIDKLSNAVKSTLGPGGKGVIIKKAYMNPFITKDGVTVAQSIFLEDPIEDIGAQLIKEVASKTVEAAGDGTTTATVLAQAIFNGGLMALSSHVDPVEMKKGIDMAVAAVVKKLKDQSKPVKEHEVVKQVAMISTNNDEVVSQHIADAIMKIGENGYITAEESNGVETHVKITEGMRLDRGYLSHHFITNVERMLVEYDNPVILLADKRITDHKELMPAFEYCASNKKPLIIIADDVDGSALATMIINKNKGGLRCAAVRCPYMGGQKKILLDDIAYVTGATVISEDAGYTLENLSIEHLGTCEKISISKDSTIIMSGGGDKKELEKRIAQIKQEITESRDENETFRLKTRLAKLDGGYAIIYVGGPTETEMKERKYRVDDAIYAAIAATEEGIVPGGGIALVRCLKVLEGMIGTNNNQYVNEGIAVVHKALHKPISTISENKNIPAHITLNRIDQPTVTHHVTDSYGWNARTDEFGDMFAMGIVDPTKVVRLALENAASIAGLLLNTEAIVYEKLPKVPVER